MTLYLFLMDHHGRLRDKGYVTGIAVATKDFAIYLPIQHMGGGNLDKGSSH